MAVGAIVLCRLDSTRLPGKVLRPVGGKPLLDYLLARARRIPELDALILATSDRAVDDPIAAYGQQRGLPVFRGPAEDVAARALACARHHGLRRFCRMNGDSPFVEPALVSLALRTAEEGEFDLVTNLCPRTFPYGVSGEVIDTEAFARAYRQMDRPEHFEHVTRYFYDNLEQFRFINIASAHGDQSAYRLTIDTEDDLHRFERVLEALGNDWEAVSYRDVLPLLDRLDATAVTASPVHPGSEPV
jgi:spore coat polysaccharide biosynthesis protein SpsF